MLSTEPSLTSPARDLSQALTHVPAVRAQLDRIARWTPPAWPDHIAILLDLIERV